jgi:hypothetical protein
MFSDFGLRSTLGRLLPKMTTGFRAQSHWRTVLGLPDRTLRSGSRRRRAHAPYVRRCLSDYRRGADGFTGPALHLSETWAGAVFGVAFGDFAALTRWIVLSEKGGKEENDGAEAFVSKLLFQARLTSEEMMQGERPLFESYDGARRHLEAFVHNGATCRNTDQSGFVFTESAVEVGVSSTGRAFVRS